MSTRTRLSVCYAAPGQNLRPSAGPTRNVLNVAEALAEWADVTVAFRNILEPVAAGRYRVMAIDPGAVGTTDHGDDNATRGAHPVKHLAYCGTLSSFARQHARSFDVVLEKGWRLSGFLAARFQRVGVPAVLVENDVRSWNEPLDGFASGVKYLLHALAHGVARTCSRRLGAVIAETDELKAMLVERRGLSPDRIEVVPLGVDHSVFHPSDQASAREALGIPPGALVMLYVGGMDEYHDLEPAIDALGRSGLASTELHVVGGGEYRARCEERARKAGVVARFHGRLSHTLVPRYIAASDVCLAPYKTSAFRGGVVTFSTLKIPEYMACGRAVISVPSPSIRRLVTHRESGFLIPNELDAWVSLLRDLPSRDRLARMGDRASSAVESITWANTAARYLEVCERIMPATAGLHCSVASPTCHVG